MYRERDICIQTEREREMYSDFAPHRAAALAAQRRRSTLYYCVFVY